MDMQRGIICSLTNEKAGGESACDKYEADETAERAQREKLLQELGSKPITGWLAFFLWVGLGGGGVVSLFTTITDIASNQYSLFYTLLHGGTTLILFSVACYAIWAFHNRRSNAVAVAKTYIAMVLIDGIFGVAAALIVADSELVTAAMRSLVWVAVWYSYLRRSTQVEEFIPSYSRSWGKAEKYALVLFGLGYITMLVMLLAQSSVNVLFTDEAYIRQTVEAAQADLPIDMGDGVEISNIEYDQGTIRYFFRNRDLLKSEFEDDYFAGYAPESKAEILSGWREDLVGDDFMSCCCKAQTTIVYTYLDRSDEYLYEVVITPEDYAGILEEYRSVSGGLFPAANVAFGD